MQARRAAGECKVVETSGMRPQGPDRKGLVGHAKKSGLCTTNSREPELVEERRVKEHGPCEKNRLRVHRG